MTLEITEVDYHDTTQAQQLVELLNHYALDPMGGGQPLTDYCQEHLADKLSVIPGAFSLIAYADGQPAGFSNCFQSFSTFACQPLINIHDIAVLSSHRGKGVAQKLLQKIDEIAVQRKCCKVTLEVLEGNVAAKTAYLKHGFTPYQMNPAVGLAQFWQKSV